MTNTVFYETLKIEVQKGQYILSEMMNKIEIALAKGYLTFENAEELKALAETCQDASYSPAVTLEKRLSSAEVEILNNKLCIAELSEMIFQLEDQLSHLENNTVAN